MGNKKDGKKSLRDFFVSFDPEEINSVESTGNTDAKILAKAFDEMSKGGLTSKERTKIEAFDNILDGADIVINETGTAATIAQTDGHTFSLKANKGKGK